MSELLKQAGQAPVRKLLPELQSTLGAGSSPQAADHRAVLSVTFADELATLREEAKSDGYLAGYDAGKIDVTEHFAKKARELSAQHEVKRAELDTVIGRLAALSTAMEVAQQRALVGLEPAAVAIAFSGLTRLLEQADTYHAALVASVRRAITVFGQQHPFVISVSESDAAILSTVDELSAWREQLNADKSLEAGSCLIECGPRALDASLLTQVDRLREALLTSAKG